MAVTEQTAKNVIHCGMTHSAAEKANIPIISSELVENIRKLSAKALIEEVQIRQNKQG